MRLKRATACYLTEADVIQLLADAGITVDDWRHDGYHLARLHDTGDYTVGNCRFILATENYAEHVFTDKQRVAASNTIKRVNATRTHEEYVRVGKLAGASPCNTGGWNKFTEVELRERFELVSHLEPNRWGFGVRAHKILGCSQVHVRRLKRRWKKLGWI